MMTKLQVLRDPMRLYREEATGDVEGGSGVRSCLTYRGDSAGGREGADGASALAEGVPEHVVEVSVRDEQKECNRNTIAIAWRGDVAGG